MNSVHQVKKETTGFIFQKIVGRLFWLKLHEKKTGMMISVSGCFVSVGNEYKTVAFAMKAAIIPKRASIQNNKMENRRKKQVKIV